MAEVSLTGWLDPALKYFAEQSGIPVADYSSQVGGEGIGTSLEILADVFTKGWFNKVIQVTAGLLSTGYAVWGKGVPSRLRKELLALGTHELLRIFDIDQNMAELQSGVTSTVEAIKRGDWNTALSLMFKSPQEVQAKMASLGVAPMATPKVAPKPTPQTSTSTTVGSKGRYVVNP